MIRVSSAGFEGFFAEHVFDFFFDLAVETFDEEVPQDGRQFEETFVGELGVGGVLPEGELVKRDLEREGLGDAAKLLEVRGRGVPVEFEELSRFLLCLLHSGGRKRFGARGGQEGGGDDEVVLGLRPQEGKEIALRVVGVEGEREQLLHHKTEDAGGEA